MKDQNVKKPFFARLLESQRLGDDQRPFDIIKPDQTMKAPSDNDEW